MCTRVCKPRTVNAWPHTCKLGVCLRAYVCVSPGRARTGANPGPWGRVRECRRVCKAACARLQLLRCRAGSRSHHGGGEGGARGPPPPTLHSQHPPSSTRELHLPACPARRYYPRLPTLPALARLAAPPGPAAPAPPRPALPGPPRATPGPAAMADPKYADLPGIVSAGQLGGVGAPGVRAAEGLRVTGGAPPLLAPTQGRGVHGGRSPRCPQYGGRREGAGGGGCAAPPPPQGSPGPDPRSAPGPQRAGRVRDQRPARGRPGRVRRGEGSRGTGIRTPLNPLTPLPSPPRPGRRC